jgi:hypothetical protein
VRRKVPIPTWIIAAIILWSVVSLIFVTESRRYSNVSFHLAAEVLAGFNRH